MTKRRRGTNMYLINTFTSCILLPGLKSTRSEFWLQISNPAFADDFTAGRVE
jgi:hypothetical protein